ncbi:MAG: phosphate signaling complex protein PhoU [Caldibacillus sp.]
MSARERFDDELKKLQNKLAELCNFAQQALAKSINAFANRDLNACIEIIDGDNTADLLYEEINDDSILLIAKQQPVARDLRKIVITIKMATDFERVADFAVNIAKSTIRLEEKPDEDVQRVISRLIRMYEISNQMLVEGLKAFENEDIQLAKKVAEMDDEVDDLYGVTIKELFKLNQEKPDSFDTVTQLLLICRYLERTADHITNVAENVIYLVKGKHFDLNE